MKTPPGLLTSAVTGLKTRSTVDTADQRARCNENDTDWGTQLGFFYYLGYFVLGCLSLGLDWILNNVQMKKKIVIIIVLTPEVITSHYFMSDGSDIM